MNTFAFRSAYFKQLGRAGKGEMSRQMIRGMRTALGFFLSSCVEESSHMQPFLIRRGTSFPLQIKIKQDSFSYG